MRGAIPLIVCVLVGALLVAFPVDAFDIEEWQNKLADVSAFTGEVLVRVAGRWGMVEESGIPLFPGDKLVTRMGRARLDLRGGTSVVADVDSNTTLDVETDAMMTTMRVQVASVICGRIWYDVKSEDWIETEIATDAAVLTDLRGRGVVYIGQGGSTTVIQMDGSVRVSSLSEGGGSVVLGPGEGTTIEPGGSPSTPSAREFPAMPNVVPEERLNAPEVACEAPDAEIPPVEIRGYTAPPANPAPPSDDLTPVTPDEPIGPGGI